MTLIYDIVMMYPQTENCRSRVLKVTASHTYSHATENIGYPWG